MNTSELRDVLNSHRNITEIQLESLSSCEMFWNELTSYVYYRLPSSEDNLDMKVNETMTLFANTDSLVLINKAGRILKRFAKFYKEHNGEKLSNEVQGIIGDRLQYYIQQSQNTFFADFTDDIDWQDGKFGKSGSCWWGTYGASREVFTDNGGWGIRFYDNKDDTYGIGRTWLLPRDGMILGFNSYGVSRAQTSKVIKSIFAQHGIKLHYKQAGIENSQNSDIPYINGDSGFVLFPDDMNPDDVPSDFDLDMDVPDDDRETCEHCGTRFSFDGGGSVVGDYCYCDDCIQELFSYCDACSEYCDRDDVHEVKDSSNYSYICRYCAERKDFALCENCEKYTENYVITDDTSECYCESCQDGNVYYCESCDEWNTDEHHHNDDSDDENSNDDTEQDTDDINIVDDELIQSIDTVSIHTGEGVKEFTIPVYRVPNVTGIFLYNVHHTRKDKTGWNISHESSGLAVKSDFDSFTMAKSVLQAIASLTDWNQTKEQLINTVNLMSLISTTINKVMYS